MKKVSLFIFITFFSFIIYSAEINTSFNIIFDAEFLKNIDDVVEHVALDSGNNFLTNVSQTNFSLFSDLIKTENKDLKAVLEFDFMGDNGFEIVSAYLYYRYKNLELYAGKLENLVSTTEKTLNYDGYYSAGGIQTGAKANQRQIQVGYLINNFKLSLSITDELPTNGGLEELDYHLTIPALEASIFFENNFLNSRIALHLGKIELDNDSFTSFIIMNESNLKLKDFLFKLSLFFSSAGSQFVVVDEMIDLYLINNELNAEENYGGFFQIIYEKKKLGIWTGLGLFDTTSDSVDSMKNLGIDFMVSNLRFSLGIEYEILKNTKLSFEYSKFITDRIISQEEKKFYGNSFHFQLSVEF